MRNLIFPPTSESLKDHQWPASSVLFVLRPQASRSTIAQLLPSPGCSYQTFSFSVNSVHLTRPGPFAASSGKPPRIPTVELMPHSSACPQFSEPPL